MKNAEQLINDVEEAKSKWDERSQFKIKGVGNLSMSDLDQLVLYANTYIDNSSSFRGLMEPMGDIKKVLDKYGIKDSSGGLF